MEKYNILRYELLKNLPEDLLLTDFSYEEKYFKKTDSFIIVVSLPIKITIANLQMAIDAGMSTSIIPKVLGGEKVYNKFCFAFRTMKKTNSFYFWSETNEDLNPLRLPYFQSINFESRSYGVKPVDEFPNVLGGLLSSENNEENLVFYINNIVNRSKQFLKNNGYKINLKTFLFELFSTHKDEQIELLTVRNLDLINKTIIQKFKKSEIIKSIPIHEDYSIKYVIDKLS